MADYITVWEKYDLDHHLEIEVIIVSIFTYLI